MRSVYWIETELSRHFEELDLGQGADLDQNGKIEGSERTDQNGDGEVDSAEWQKFMGDNKAALKKLGGHFEQYYSAGTAFKPDNPIHDLLSIESEIASQDDVEKAYKKVEEVLRIVKKRLSKAKHNPKEKLKLVYDIIEQVGIEYDAEDRTVTFVESINESTLDCDTSSFVAFAVAYELNWPVSPVRAPAHVFVRWDDGAGTKFNMDQGRIVSDSYYVSWLNLSHKTVKQGVYLTNLGHRQVLAFFYQNRGSAKYELGRYEDAIEDYDKAIELDPKFTGAYLNRGNAKLPLERYEEVIEDCNKVVEIDPKLAIAYVNRGIAKDQLGRHKDAIKDHDKAIELNPNLAGAYFNRGVAKRRLGRHEEAIEDFDKAIELDPKSADAYANRGFTKDKLGKYAGAIEDYDSAIELDPEFVDAYINRGIVKDALKRYEEAIEDYDRAVELDPKNAPVYRNRGDVKFELERYDEAIEDYDKAIEFNPSDPHAYNNRGNAKSDLERYEEAIEDYDKAVELNPNLALAYHNRGNAKLRLERHKEAIKDFDKAIELGLNDPRVHKLREEAKQKLAQDEEPEEGVLFGAGVPPVRPSNSCLCAAPGQTGHSSPSEQSLLSLLMAIIFD